MNFNWIIIKSITLFVVFILSIFQKVEIYGDTPPFFIYPVISVVTFIFGTLFFKGAATNKRLSKGTFENSPLKIFSDPLPS